LIVDAESSRKSSVSSFSFKTNENFDKLLDAFKELNEETKERANGLKID